jgi:hypothetical protein
MKDGLQGRHFPDDTVITAVRKCLPPLVQIFTNTDEGMFISDENA